jgi:serine/threonine-protein kinase HipA
MKNIESLNVSCNGRKVGTLSLTPDNHLCTFEYDDQWLVEGFSISPLELPLRQGIFIAKPQPFYGNFGVFEDSLPDGYGRYLLHKTLLQQGIDDMSLSALQRLSIVGSGGMGALNFTPATKVYEETDVPDLDILQQKALDVLGEKNDDDAALLLYNSMNSGGCRPKTLLTDDGGHWLVKFRHTYDPQDMGQMEYRYNEVAKQCGINVPDFKLLRDKYFASRRFDIDSEGNRIHTVTAGGLLCVSLSSPVLDYINLLALTGFLTQNPEDVEEMYRRMVFNYLSGNKDDHCKNFSFSCINTNGKWQWRLAPAYDLTLCNEGYNGQHATSVNFTSSPSLADMIAVGKKAKMTEKRCRTIFDEVNDCIGEIKVYEVCNI